MFDFIIVRNSEAKFFKRAKLYLLEKKNEYTDEYN